MRRRTTLILLLICSGLGAYVYFHERFQAGTGELERSAHLVLTLNRQEIDSIAIKRRDGEIQLKRDNASGHWTLTAPIEDRAKLAAVTSILKLADEFTITRSVPAEEVASGEIKVVDIGLDGTNSVQVTFGSKGAAQATLLVGNAAPWDDTVYCKVLDDPDRKDIYVAATKARPILLQPAEAFRDDFLSGIQFNDLVSISIKQGSAADIEVVRDRAADDALWFLSKPLQTLADSDLLDTMLKRFLKARVEVFVAASSATAPAPSDEAVVVTFGTQQAQEATITLEPPSDATSGLSQTHTSDRSGTFLLSNDFYEMFATPEREVALWELLRSRQLGRMDLARLNSVVFQRQGQPRVPVWLYGNAWHLLRESTVAEQADKGSLHRLVTGLNEIVIDEFASETGEELEKFGLDEPRVTLVFSTVKQPSATAFDYELIGPKDSFETVTLFVSQGANGKIYAKYDREPFVYRVPPAILNLFPLDSIEWKNRNLLELQQSSIQAITISRPPAPPVQFIYDSTESKWTAERSGEDITELVDENLVEQFRQKIAVFSAHQWETSFKPLEELRAHLLEIRLTGKTFEEESGGTATHVLRFVPKGPIKTTGYFYGQLEGVAEPFIIKRDTFNQLNQSLLREKNGRGKPAADQP
jgi:hypothetical protein